MEYKSMLLEMGRLSRCNQNADWHRAYPCWMPNSPSRKCWRADHAASSNSGFSAARADIEAGAVGEHDTMIALFTDFGLHGPCRRVSREVGFV
jgi:hypothetical protein